MNWQVALRYHFSLINRSLSRDLFPDRVPNHLSLHLPAIFPQRSRPMSRLCARQFSRLCSRSILDYVADRFPDCVLDHFPDYVPDHVPDLLPNPSRDPAPPSVREIPSRRVNQMVPRISYFPSHSRPPLSKREPFPIPSLGENQILFPPAAG